MPSERILVVAPSWVGDAILSEPLIALVREPYEEPVVDVLAPPWCAPVYARMRGIREVIESPLAHGRFDNVSGSLSYDAAAQSGAIDLTIPVASVATAWDSRDSFLRGSTMFDGERYPLMGAMTVLGRDDSADIVLDDPGISRRHSEIRVTTDGPHLVASIRDLNSTNGTFVNSERISSQRLADGDRITVGRATVTYRAGRR